MALNYPGSGLTDNRYQFIAPGQENLYGPGVLEQADATAGYLQQMGPWQPYMTSVDQFLQPSGFTRDQAQQALDLYTKFMGTPQEQADRQSYYTMMGGTDAGHNYGGVISQPIGRMNMSPSATDRMHPGDPWSTLNSMGISQSYDVPSWQDAYFTINSGPGSGVENYNPWYTGGGTSTPSWGNSSNWFAGSGGGVGASSATPWSARSSGSGPWG